MFEQWQYFRRHPQTLTAGDSQRSYRGNSLKMNCRSFTPKRVQTSARLPETTNLTGRASACLIVFSIYRRYCIKPKFSLRGSHSSLEM